MEWGQCGISYNPNLTIEWIEKYPDKPWDWGYYGISGNPNISLKIIQKYINKIDFSVLVKNKFNYIKNKINIQKNKIKLFYYLDFTKLIYDLQRHIITF